MHHQGVLVQVVLKQSLTTGFVQETIFFRAALAPMHPGLARDVDQYGVSCTVVQDEDHNKESLASTEVVPI